jgi:hypothetical protein
MVEIMAQINNVLEDKVKLIQIQEASLSTC